MLKRTSVTDVGGRCRVADSLIDASASDGTYSPRRRLGGSLSAIPVQMLSPLVPLCSTSTLRTVHVAPSLLVYTARQWHGGIRAAHPDGRFPPSLPTGGGRVCSLDGGPPAARPCQVGALGVERLHAILL